MCAPTKLPPTYAGVLHPSQRANVNEITALPVVAQTSSILVPATVKGDGGCFCAFAMPYEKVTSSFRKTLDWSHFSKPHSLAPRTPRETQAVKARPLVNDIHLACQMWLRYSVR